MLEDFREELRDVLVGVVFRGEADALPEAEVPGELDVLLLLLVGELAEQRGGVLLLEIRVEARELLPFAELRLLMPSVLDDDELAAGIALRLQPIGVDEIRVGVV